MQDKEPNVSKHTSDVGCQVNTQLKETSCLTERAIIECYPQLLNFKPSTKINVCWFEFVILVTLFWKFQGVWKTQIANSE